VINNHLGVALALVIDNHLGIALARSLANPMSSSRASSSFYAGEACLLTVHLMIGWKGFIDSLSTIKHRSRDPAAVRL
jgi:hypothetical protein